MMSYRNEEILEGLETVQLNLMEGNEMRDLLKPRETWQQDIQDTDLWHGVNGVIVNSMALKEREFFFEVVRVSN